MVTEQDVGKTCRYVVDGLPAAEGKLLSVSGRWARIREQLGDRFRSDDFPAGLCEVVEEVKP